MEDGVELSDTVEATLRDRGEAFDRSLPHPDQILSLSFRNYLRQQSEWFIRASSYESDDEWVAERITGIAQDVILADTAKKEQLLRDDSLAEFIKVTDTVFSLAKKTFYAEDCIPGCSQKASELKDSLMRARFLAYTMLNHNIAYARKSYSAACTDLKLLKNPFFPDLSERMTACARARGPRHQFVRRTFYARLEKLWGSQALRKLARITCEDEEYESVRELFCQVKEECKERIRERVRPSEPQVAKALECPICGGALSFDTTTNRVTCVQCGRALEKEEMVASSLSSRESTILEGTYRSSSADDYLKRAPWSMQGHSYDIVTYTCPSCGESLQFGQNVLLDTCPHCGNVLVLYQAASQSNLPQHMIPFRLTEEQAIARLRDFCSHKWYLPRGFEPELVHRRAIYVPFYEYDADAVARASYIGSFPVGDSRSDERLYVAAKREAEGSYEHLVVNASAKIPDSFIDAVGPYDPAQFEEFVVERAAGCVLELADEDADLCWGRAESRIRKTMEKAMRADMEKGQSHLLVEKCVSCELNTKREVKNSYVLPVWLFDCTWEGKELLFAVNGCTGKCVGELPVSQNRRFFTVSAVALFCLLLVGSCASAIGSHQSEAVSVARDPRPMGALVLLVFVAIAVIAKAIDSGFMGEVNNTGKQVDASSNRAGKGTRITLRWESAAFRRIEDAQRILDETLSVEMA